MSLTVTNERIPAINTENAQPKERKGFLAKISDLFKKYVLPLGQSEKTVTAKKLDKLDVKPEGESYGDIGVVYACGMLCLAALIAAITVGVIYG